MSSATELWNGFSGKAKSAIIVGVFVIATLLLIGSWWIYHADYQVLFSDLTPNDSQSVSMELDR